MQEYQSGLLLMKGEIFQEKLTVDIFIHSRYHEVFLEKSNTYQ